MKEAKDIMSDYVETLKGLGVMKADGNMSGACYRCQHRGTIGGDAHSRCCHPVIEGGTSNMISGLVAMLDPNSNGAMIRAAAALKIAADPHGIASGWFMWPYNFDPTWLIFCAGFEQSKDDKEATAIAS